jgi:GTPase SAR1 family protein
MSDVSPEKQAVLDELLNSMVNPEESNPRARLLIYGPSGAGKTVLAMRLAKEICPPGRNIIHIDFANGWDVLENTRWQHLKKDAIHMRYQGVSQLTYLALAMNGAKSPPPFNNIGVIVLDESTSMSDSDVDLVTRSRAKKDPSKDPDDPKMPDMGISSRRFKSALNELQGTNAHIIQLGHVRKDKDNLQIEVSGPAFMPKLSSKICETQLVVGHATADSIETADPTIDDDYKRFIQVQPTRRVVAKCRIDGVKEKISHDEFIQIVSEFVNGKRKETDVEVIGTEINDSSEENTVEDNVSTFAIEVE